MGPDLPQELMMETKYSPDKQIFGHIQTVAVGAHFVKYYLLFFLQIELLEYNLAADQILEYVGSKSEIGLTAVWLLNTLYEDL